MSAHTQPILFGAPQEPSPKPLKKARKPIIGTPIQFLDWGNYPMILTDARVEQLTKIIGDFEPTVILTHSEKYPFNPDHPLAFQAVQRARLLSSGAKRFKFASNLWLG